MRIKENQLTIALKKMMSLDFQNIIIRMPNWLGDSVMATPILEDVRKRWPRARITVMCLESMTGLFFGNPHIDEIFSFSKSQEFSRRQANRDIIERLKQGKYDLGLLLTHSFSSALWFWKAGIKERVGFRKDFRSLFLTKSRPLPKEAGKEHLVTTYKRVLHALEMDLSESFPALFVTENEKRAAEAFMRKHHIPEDATLIGVNPLAAFGPAKCWLKERFRELTETLLNHSNFYILYFGDKKGLHTLNEICAGLPARVINLGGQTSLRELIALIQRCDLFLSNDSGPMHLAAALKTPLVAIFGSTNDVATGPYKHGVIIHKRVECSPCYKKVCPIDFRCMKRIEVEEVYQAVLNELFKAKPSLAEENRQKTFLVL